MRAPSGFETERTLLGMLLRHRAGTLTPERTRLAEDLVLPAEIRRQPGEARPHQLSSVLLTGATGFLGAFVLRALLERSAARVVCVVRGASAAACAERLRAHLERLEIDLGPAWDRVQLLPGDLGFRDLGLADPRTHAMLADTLDGIVHVGAHVNFLFPYSDLRASNVEGTREILRLAALGRPKAVHVVSSTSVVTSPALALRSVSEQQIAEDPETLPGGYPQSKWVAEALATLARRRNVPVSISRPSFIGWNSATGIASGADFPTLLIEACLLLGAAPETDILIDLVPVDAVARTVVALLEKSESAGKTFHLVNPRPVAWTEVVAHLRGLGATLELLPFDAWQARVAEHAPGDSRLRGLQMLLPSGTGHQGYSLFEALSPASLPLLERANLLEVLGRAQAAFPLLDGALLAPLWRQLQREPGR